MAETQDVAMVLQREGLTLLERARALVVVDDTTFRQADELDRLGKDGERRIKEFMDPICDAANRAHKEATSRRAKLLEIPGEVRRLARAGITTYEQEQARLAQEAAAAAERERQRLEAEARVQAEREQARLRKEAEDRRLEEAAAAEAAGDVETATKLIEAPVEVPTVEAAPVFMPPAPVFAPPEIQGRSFRSQWKAQCVDLKLVVRAAAAGNQTALACLMWNDVAANGLARSTRGGVRVDGIRFFEERITTTH